MQPEAGLSNYPRSPKSRYHLKAVAAWLHCAGFTLICSVILAGLLAVITQTVVGPVALLDFTWFTIGSYVLVLPMLAICSPLFPITISSGGLKAFNGFGVYSTIGWDDLRQLRTINLAGFKYYRFKRDRMLFPVMVPVDLDDRKMFVQEVARYLGDKNPIVLDLLTQWKLPPEILQSVSSSLGATTGSSLHQQKAGDG